MIRPFSVLFAEQDSSKIEYNGKKVNAFYSFDKKGIYKLKFSFISTNAACKQAVVFHLGDFKGTLSVNGEKIKKPKGRFPQIIFEEGYKGCRLRKFEVQIEQKEGELVICNGSADARVPKICRSLNGGCAMIIEEIEENRLRFFCNDYENDDDFDDLIFDLEIEKIE